MPPLESESRAAREQLERVLASPGFARNERLSRFLRFVVERHLEGRDQELKESLIAIEVFGRPPGYDPKEDSIVRTEASRLRARLSEFYVGEGRGDSLTIELPKGGYVPVLRPGGGGPGPNPLPRVRHALPIEAAIACVAIALAAVGYRWFHRNAPIPIAVLPLINLSQDPANDYFTDGLTGEIIRNLSIIEGLAVRSQTSSFAFKGKPRKAHDAGKQLDADYILEGSAQRAGQQLRITVQLVRASDDFPLWSGRYDRELTDIFAVQDEIARGIVNSLRLKLGRGRRRYETSVEAYDLYLRARASRGDEMIGRFEEAITKDPAFAPAYAGLAEAYAIRSGEFGFDLPDELLKMRIAARKAIQLDPLSAEAHDALAMAYERDGQWEQSERSFRRAIELDPSGSESYYHLAYGLLLPLGRIGEALQQLRAAEKNDPLSPGVHLRLARVLMSAGRYDEAADHCQKLPAEFSNKEECLGRARLGQGRTGEAIQILKAWDRPTGRAYLGYAYGKAGRREEAEKLAAAAAPNPFSEALIFAGLGDKDRTLEALDRVAQLGPVRIGRALNSPEFALLHGDPRVKALRKKVGLPE